jgi:glycogen debranching enzyme
VSMAALKYYVPERAMALDSTCMAAIESLRLCCSPRGLKASGRPLGHHQIWARDSMIALLGARFAEDGQIQDALRASLTLLGERRGPHGAIPNNVNPATLRANFRAYADGGLWWIIGSALAAPDLAAPDLEAVREVLRWYECQDVDQTGLLSMQEASDWQDLFCTRGKGLYLNCLYVIALQRAAELFDGEERASLRRRADLVTERINFHFWYSGGKDMRRHLAHTFSTEGSPLTDSLGRPREIPEKRYLIDEQYYLPYLGFRSVGEWFDSLGNLLAILAGVASQQQGDIILDFISRHSMDQWPLRSLTPAVRPGDPDWRGYYGSLNAPHHYHNGGVWPFLGGFYIAALVKGGRAEAAANALQSLTQLNQCGQFNEWHHGETGAPMGAQDQAWSAGMQLFAWECVRRGQVALP